MVKICLMKSTALVVLLLSFALCSVAFAQVKPRRAAAPAGLPEGYWPLERSQPIVEKTQTIRLAPDLSHLSEGERRAVAKLIAAGHIFQRLYEEQRHPRAVTEHGKLETMARRAGARQEVENLLTLYRLFQGPIATTLENKREPFLPVEPPAPGKNVYPWGVKKEEIEAFLAAHPEERASILHLRTVVRRTTVANLKNDLSALARHRALSTLHPGLEKKLNQLMLSARGRTTRLVWTRSIPFYAVPYSVAYADDLVRAHGLLNEAADAVEQDDEEFARFLRNRARDLLSDDYESGDAAWVTGRFKNLNAQIGSYEVYDDELYGVKSFFSFNLLAARRQETEALRKAMRGLQALEDSLPYANHKKVREDIPVGVYDVVADFGQSRGGNTATILPNESYLARRYGRTILLRANIMQNPDLFQSTGNAWGAAGADRHKGELTSEGSSYRTLWHEVGHYLGVDATKDGRDLDTALQDTSSLLEEMKADLVSLFVAEALRKQGYYTDAQLRSVYASGVNRVLQNNRPRRDQPYNTMELMQWNYFLERGLLSFDPQAGRLRINYGDYHEVAGDLLKKVLDVQSQGDRAAAERFVEEYTKWDENLHGVIARNIRDQQRYRFRLFKYAALGE
jgi:hypothetical protein